MVKANRTTSRGLKSLKNGQAGKVSGFSDERVATKLMAMGVLPGSEIRIVRKAPFGGAYIVSIDNIQLALRNNEVESILLET